MPEQPLLDQIQAFQKTGPKASPKKCSNAPAATLAMRRSPSQMPTMPTSKMAGRKGFCQVEKDFPMRDGRSGVMILAFEHRPRLAHFMRAMTCSKRSSG